MRRMWALGAAVLTCVMLEGPIAVAQEVESPASPSPIPTTLAAEIAQSILTVEVTDLVGMEGLELGVWDSCSTGPSTWRGPIPLLRSVPIDASPFEAAGSLELEVCSTGVHQLNVGVAENYNSDWQYACVTYFDLSSGEVIWIRIVGLPPIGAGASCSMAYVVHDPALMSW